jgi:hypothetical protein
MGCETNPCKRFIAIRDRSELRGDELWAVKSRLAGYVNDWRDGRLSATEAMISIQLLSDTHAASTPASSTEGGVE